MSMPKKRLPILLGYLAFAVLCLVLNLYWTFPANALAQRVASEVERETSGTWTLKFQDASPWRLTGLELDNVTLIKKENPTAEPMVLQLDTLKARLRILPLLLLRTSINTQVNIGDGVLGAVVTVLKDATDADVYFDEVDFGKSAVFSKLAGMPLGGVLNGTVNVHWTRDIHHVDTEADISIGKATVGPGKVANLVTIPSVSLGDLALMGEIKEGKIKITSFKQSGNAANIQLRASGGGQLSQPLFTSTVDACVMFKAEPQFLTNNPTMRSAVQLAEVQLKKDPEGFLNVPIGGAVNGIAVRTGNLCKK
jgi:type II secretion system protein N